MPVAAGVVGDERVRALLAARHMAAECRRAAALDRRHDLELTEAHTAGVGFTPRRSMAAEDIRDLHRWTRHVRRASGGRLSSGFIPPGHQRREAIQRAHDLADGVGGDARVERRGLEPGVPEQNLDHPNIDVLLEQVGREAMALMPSSA
jgi:hypothetical protein